MDHPILLNLVLSSTFRYHYYTCIIVIPYNNKYRPFLVVLLNPGFFKESFWLLHLETYLFGNLTGVRWTWCSVIFHGALTRIVMWQDNYLCTDTCCEAFKSVPMWGSSYHPWVAEQDLSDLAALSYRRTLDRIVLSSTCTHIQTPCAPHHRL